MLLENFSLGSLSYGYTAFPLKFCHTMYDNDSKYLSSIGARSNIAVI